MRQKKEKEKKNWFTPPLFCRQDAQNNNNNKNNKIEKAMVAYKVPL
jgi:hypothetical protein